MNKKTDSLHRRETSKAVKKATNVYGYVKISDDVGTYVKLNKADFVSYLEVCDESALHQMNITKDSVYVG